MYHDSFRLDWTKDDHGTGWLCIVYSSSLWNEPELISHWWPCFPATEKEAREIHGAPCDAHDTGGGTFRVADQSVPAGCYGRWRSVTLRDGGKTKPIRTDTTEIPKPRTRVPTKYEGGRWWKQLKKGWVEA